MKIVVNDFQFGTGLTGVLGPRGVGKTKLLQQIAKTEQAAKQEAEGKLCYASQELEPFYGLTVKEYLCYIAGKHQITEPINLQIESALHQMNLTRVAHSPLFELNSFLKSQTLLAAVLVKEPQLLLLDNLLGGLCEPERMHLGYTISNLAKDRVVVYAGGPNESLEGLFDHVCLLHPDKKPVQVSANTAYSWVEGKVWEYVAPSVPDHAQGIVSILKRQTDGVYIREIAEQAPEVEEVSQVTPTLHDAYLWWAEQ